MKIGIDLGGTKIEGVLINDQDLVMQRFRVPSPSSDYHAIIRSIAEMVRKFDDEAEKINETNVQHKPSVGVGLPGSVSLKTGKMKNANTTCLNDQPFKEDLQATLGRKVKIENDANCFVLSEAIAGSGKPYKSVFGVILGTGTGGGIVVDKKLLPSRNRVAGEWGHNPMPWIASDELNKRSCYCGKLGCIETFLSGPGLQNTYSLHGGAAVLNAEEIVDLARNADQFAMNVLHKYLDHLAKGLASIMNIIDPQVIVMGGGLSNIDEIYQQVPKLMANYVFGNDCEVALLPSKLGDSSGVFGAAYL